MIDARIRGCKEELREEVGKKRFYQIKKERVELFPNFKSQPDLFRSKV